MDEEDLRQEIIQKIGESFLRGMQFVDDETGQWKSPRDAYDALDHRKEIMRDYGWDTDLIEERNPGLLTTKDLWEDTEYSIQCSFQFGDYPDVPKWVEVFSLLVGDCSKQTHYSVDNAFLFDKLFGDLFSNDPDDLLRIHQLLDLEAPSIS